MESASRRFDVLAGGAVAPRVSEPPGSALRESSAELAESVAAHDAPAGTGTTWMAAEPSLCVPVEVLHGVAAVVAVQPLKRGGGAAFALTLPVPAGAPDATGAEAGGRA